MIETKRFRNKAGEVMGISFLLDTLRKYDRK